MKKVVAACGFLVLAACAPSAPSAPVAETPEQLAARGQYLVTSIGGCNDCHTPMTAAGPDMAHALQGATLGFAPIVQIPWAPVAPPIAGGPSGYSDEQFASFLQTGVRPDGSMARPPMPQFRMNEADARAVVAYIKTLPAAPPTE